MANTQEPSGGGQDQSQSHSQSQWHTHGQPSGQFFGRPMEDAVFVALVTALLSTVVQSLMSHTSNSSATHQAALNANANTHSATLAILAKAAEQILSSGGHAPVSTAAPMDFSNSNRMGGAAGFGTPPVVT